ALAKLEIEVGALEGAAVAYRPDHVAAPDFLVPGAGECGKVAHQGEIPVSVVDDDQVSIPAEPAGVDHPAGMDGAPGPPRLASHVDAPLKGDGAETRIKGAAEMRLDAARFDREEHLAAPLL